MLDLLCMYTILAGLFTFGKRAVMSCSPFFLTGVRLIPAGGSFLLGTYFFDRKHFFMRSKDWPLLLGIVISYFAMDAFRFVGLKQVPSTHAALISCFTPFITALLAYFLGKEPLTYRKVLALCIGLVGVLPLIIQGLYGSSQSVGSFSDLAGGYLALVIMILSVVSGTLFLKQLVQKNKYSVLMALGTALFFGGIISLIVSLIIEPWNPVPITDAATVVPLIFFLFVSHNLISQPLYGLLVKKYPVTLVTFAGLATPIITALLGYLLYGHPIGLSFVFALVVLVFSFYLFYNEEKEEGLIKP